MRSRYRCFIVAAFLCLLVPRFNYSNSLLPLPVLGATWREAVPGYEYSFPRDHSAHPDYRVEWWYYTGNLESQTGHRFGYQLTFFRVGVTRGLSNPSRWALRDLYMAHFAISDIDRQRFHSFDRINRAGIGWAGADSLDSYRSDSDSKRIRIWNEDWEAKISEASHMLQAAENRYALDINLEPTKDEVIHGENGVSRRGPSSANASHYYSVSRARSSGEITVEGERFDVVGLSWIDHEFGTSFLDEKQTGWDWFSIQLEDGRDLMLFQIRREDGSIDPHSSATLIDMSGKPTHLAIADFSLEPGDFWQSPRSGARYPVGWRVSLPRYDLQLTITAAFEDQELRTPESTGVTYWEGSIIARDTKNGSIRGRGYLEMTGYTGKSMGSILR